MDREDAVRVFKDLLVSYFPEAAEFVESGSGAPAGPPYRRSRNAARRREFLADLEGRFTTLAAGTEVS
ncbi:hypothetical protein QBA38_43435 [Streptomyces stelliscabiei]|uniref:hypothetical protein n=1 Tax=Streptomyces stelliscabiei TaxID=146820 RepID=UPI002FF1EBCE